MSLKELDKIAQKIVKLELECENGANVSKSMYEMEELMKNCSVEELLEIDELIMTKYLTK